MDSIQVSAQTAVSIAQRAGIAPPQILFQYLVLKANLHSKVPQHAQYALPALYANLMVPMKFVIQASIATTLK